jgi:hypothetical protein
MKGQVSVFVIIGITAVVVVSLILLFVNADKLKLINSSHETDYTKQAKPVTDYVNQCLNKIGLSAMKKLGEQGRLYPNVYIAAKDRKIAYFYFRGKGYFPEKDELEKEFSDYIKENIRECINDFSETNLVVEDKGKGIILKSKIDDKKIIVEMTYPLNVYFGAKIIPIESFKTEIKTEFSGMYGLSEKIYTETEKNPDWISLDSLQDTGYKIRLIKVDANTLVYEISDEKGLNDAPFKYTFAVKYGM